MAVESEKYNLRIQVLVPELVQYYQDHSTFHTGDAGLDLFTPEETIVPANARGFIVNLGIKCEMVTTTRYHSYYLYPRSSLGAKTPLRLANCVGIIDSGYRGPICAILDNLSDQDYTIQKGDRLVQICRPNLKAFSIAFVKELSSSDRGEHGLGSTGK